MAPFSSARPLFVLASLRGSTAMLTPLLNSLESLLFSFRCPLHSFPILCRLTPSPWQVSRSGRAVDIPVGTPPRHAGPEPQSKALSRPLDDRRDRTVVPSWGSIERRTCRALPAAA